MFTGIVEEIGNIVALEDAIGGRRLKIRAKSSEQLQLGESISVSGCCLTVTDRAADNFTVEVVHESLRRTKLGELKVNDQVNLERSLSVGDRLGGHLVSGHIDTVAKVLSIVEEGFSKMLTFELSDEWAPFLVEKGSVAVDGVSLTVAACPLKSNFSVALIPHTLAVTTLGKLEVADVVNVETDLVARYIARWLNQYVDMKFAIQGGQSPLLEQLMETKYTLLPPVQLPSPPN